jgi:riboflavin kinase/FMN adenylyltransferase
MIVSGRVVQGRGIASGYGFPTANLSWTAVLEGLEPGVYTGRASCEALVERPAVICYTINEHGPGCFEVHLLDWNGPLYGKTMTVRVERWLNAIVLGEEEAAMREKIQQDVERAKRRFASS